MKYILLLLMICCTRSNYLMAQKTSVAVFPFVYSIPEYRSKAAQIQGIVVDLLSKKSNVDIIDRSKDTLLMKELDFQIREQSMASKGLVQQGKVVGAHDMIVGTISNIKVEEKRSGAMVAIGQAAQSVSYRAYINFSLQIMDVESGKIIKQKSFDNSKQNIKEMFTAQTAQSSEAALGNAMKVTRRAILEWLNEDYPPDIKIIKIEDRDKKGYPETILVTGIDESLPKGTRLSLNEIEMMDVGDGKKLKRSKNVADLKVSDVQGEITICRVTNGEKTIEAKMTGGTKLEVLVN